jgi:hypothetical protein
LAAHEACPIGIAASLTGLAHGCSDLPSEALWTKGLVRVRFAIPEWSAEFILVAFKAQFLPKLAVLVFQF